jgi:Skp family chaperone for outer membrane proteins
VAGLALVTSFANRASADPVYKTVDAQGHVTYSDRPTAPSAKKTEIAVQQADPAEAERLARENQLLKSEDDLRKKQQAADDKAKAQQDKAKQARCQVARDQYNAVKDAGRMFHRDADGNRVYYTDTEADARREAARQVMTLACGS